MRGRKPKPTALKLLEGARADRVNDREPTPPRGAPEAPEWLGPLAREHWGELAPGLASTGVLTLADGPALAMLCDAFERVQLAASEKGRAEARSAYLRLLAEFGLTPASRSKVKVAEAKVDALGDFLAKRKA